LDASLNNSYFYSQRRDYNHDEDSPSDANFDIDSSPCILDGAEGEEEEAVKDSNSFSVLGHPFDEAVDEPPDDEAVDEPPPDDILRLPVNEAVVEPPHDLQGLSVEAVNEPPPDLQIQPLAVSNNGRKLNRGNLFKEPEGHVRQMVPATTKKSTDYAVNLFNSTMIQVSKELNRIFVISQYITSPCAWLSSSW
jgi:hypothetical protein